MTKNKTDFEFLMQQSEEEIFIGNAQNVQWGGINGLTGDDLIENNSHQTNS